MIPSGRRCDYHVHYHADRCAHAEMTLSNIEQEAIRLKLDEICVLKHYSRELPNGESEWVFWKQVIPESFEAFLADFHSHPQFPSLRMFSGVETELVDDQGTINIEPEQAARLDAAILSVHWLPRMTVLSPDPAIIPTNRIQESPPDILAAWHDAVRTCGPEALVENLVLAYVRAMEQNPAIRVLGHMFDGLHPLRNYQVPVDTVSDDRLIRLMEPLMRACVAHEVLWELTPSPVQRPGILHHARSLGVRFCATADAHFLLTKGFANLTDHDDAEARLDAYQLPRGIMRRDR